MPPADAGSQRERDCLQKGLNFAGSAGSQQKGSTESWSLTLERVRAENDLQRLEAVASTR